MTPFALEVAGPPTQKKNRPQIGYLGAKCQLCGKGARVMIFPEAAYRKWERSALKELKQQWVGRDPLGGPKQPLRIDAVFYLGKRQRPDLSNLLEAVGDVLEKAGVISSDYWVDSWGDSRRERDWDRPRVEIVITELGQQVFAR